MFPISIELREILLLHVVFVITRIIHIFLHSSWVPLIIHLTHFISEYLREYLKPTFTCDLLLCAEDSNVNTAKVRVRKAH